MTEIWTDRTVYFQPNARYIDERWEQFFTALTDSLYRRHMPFTATVGTDELRISVSGWPWWLPKRWAMSWVCRVAAEHGVGGTATYGVERSVLVEGHLNYTKHRKQVEKGHEHD